jgi:hypothetical protein
MNISKAFAISCISLFTTSVYANDFCFVDKKHHWHFDADFAAAGNANFNKTGPARHSQLQYAEGYSSLYYNHFVTENNAIVAQLGLNYMHLGWDKNPKFNQENFYYGIASLSWVSYAIEKWRWVINGGVSFDTTTFNFGQSAVGYALLWGRYQYTPQVAMHMGFFGYYGARNGYLLPVLGIDWWWSSKWEYRIIFPLETSVHYHFHKHWSAAFMFTTFGGPYRFPRRAYDGQGKYDGSIFEVYSKGAEVDLKFKNSSCFKAGLGAGYNFGGWILIKNRYNHHGRYYKFNDAPYARAYLAFSF